MKYVVTIALDEETITSDPVDKEVAEALLELAELGDNVRWAGYKPYKG